MQLGEMQHFNNTPLGEMQSGEMQFSHYNTLLGLDLFVKIIFKKFGIIISEKKK